MHVHTFNIQGKLSIVQVQGVQPYLLEPISQNIVPNKTAMTAVKRNLTAVYGGFLQYDKFCFQRQALHCVKKGCEYRVGKNKSSEPGGGVLNSSIMFLFLLNAIHNTKLPIRSRNVKPRLTWLTDRLTSFPNDPLIRSSIWKIDTTDWCRQLGCQLRFSSLPVQFRLLVCLREVNLESCFVLWWSHL